MFNILYWTSLIPTTTIGVVFFLLGLGDVYTIQTNPTQQLRCPTKIEHRGKFIHKTNFVIIRILHI
jgi:hypothetical protein